MQRRPSTQDITWLLDLHQNNQLNLTPPYQRRSVWTSRDKQFFLDTVFRNYPSPAVFLHKTISETGKATYHVVDGKQRIQTILDFVENKIRVGKEFGDARLDGKRWKDLNAETDLKQRFWNYQLTVELIDWVDGTVVNEVFDRLNRNARKLTNQELRHAKFEGWFLKEAESESERDDWRALGVSTTARVKRMLDTQFISELMLVVIDNSVRGFDQEGLDEAYAMYDDPAETAPELDIDEFKRRFAEIRQHIIEMESHNSCITTHARGVGHLYTLWSVFALSQNWPSAHESAELYANFMRKFEEIAEQQNLEEFLAQKPQGEYTNVIQYFNFSRGASTDGGPRIERLNALMPEIIRE
ncbi:DUF262 domain-containing protein [Pseudomonas sp. zfem005]|uniref:DUF262 domain-containing protein n=1 Tax=Pseudomonas sp. zfem005 TaxID=3078200 RepID=UPI002927E7E1|nr:DUF262 domain-containing protein [Pseudomonas sp. zfem005]MDU9414993.1 DUF262 domain-containing protein [Pseudomonas sp. zfem005]